MNQTPDLFKWNKYCAFFLIFLAITILSVPGCSIFAIIVSIIILLAGGALFVKDYIPFFREKGIKVKEGDDQWTNPSS